MVSKKVRRICIHRAAYPVLCLAIGLGLVCQAPKQTPTAGPGQTTPTAQPAQETGPATAIAPEPKEGGETMSMTLTSSAFGMGTAIPDRHTGKGPDVSPPLAWTDPPPGTKSFALVCDDPDAPMGTWVHWVIYGIPATARDLPQGVPAQEALPNGAKQGLNDFRKVGYNGPMPPPGKPHRYFFKLYALDTDIALGPRATKKMLEDAMKGHVLGEAQLMGTYQR